MGLETMVMAEAPKIVLPPPKKSSSIEQPSVVAPRKNPDGSEAIMAALNSMGGALGTSPIGPQLPGINGGAVAASIAGTQSVAGIGINNVTGGINMAPIGT